MADGSGTIATSGAIGRPRKARGAANSSDAADARWTVRGVPLNVRAMAIKAAESRGMTVGDWLAEAVVAYARADGAKVSADASGVSADGGSNVPAMPLSADLAKLLEDIQGRLAKVELARRPSGLGRLFGRRN